MAQTIFLPRSNVPTYPPQSPDPTPLRMIAFSVAESALQSDPNSPSFDSLPRAPRPFNNGQWLDQWALDEAGSEPKPSKGGSVAVGRVGEGKRLMSVIGRAKERRQGENRLPAKYSSSTPSSPPLSPSYNFVLPSNTPLAASIAATPRHTSLFTQRNDIATPPHLVKRSDTPPSNPSRPTPPNITVTPPSKKTAPLYIRSVEPSPTRPMFGGLSPTASTFAGLDRDKPPPEFVPRLSAKELSAKLRINETTRTRRSSTAEMERNVPVPHKLIVKLPSLAQIQAKISKGDDEVQRPSPRVNNSAPSGVNSSWISARRGNVHIPCRPIQTDSPGSVEVLTTPTDEVSPHARILSSLDRRPGTPPSPTLQHGKDSHRLASFLRQRTTGRLSKVRPVSMPPLAAGETLNFDAFLPAMVPVPRSTSTSPTGRFFTHSQSSLPGRAAFTGANIATPPHRGLSLTPSLISPTDSTHSYRSSSSTGSPTLAVPMITCTPAPARLLKDGVEQDSDEEGNDVVLFEGDAEWSDAEDGEERGKLGRLMKERLELRRTSP